LSVPAACHYIGGGMTRLVVATRNGHKVREIRAILGERYQYLALNDFPDAPKTVEDADTFAGNATKKAIELAQWLATRSALDLRSSALLVLADDSGLEVDALKGAPGVYSARFAAGGVSAVGLPASPTGNSADADNNAKLLRLLNEVPWEKRTARFRCVLALTPVLTAAQAGSSPVCFAEERELRTELFEGVCDGRIGFAPRGQGGFGYDPLFIPDGHEQSFAELGEEVKNKISHRARAVAKLRERLLSKPHPCSRDEPSP
jgi:XTP/dITP diphosphohydrolase